jgi:O-antigen/teichoic acid export membrane protein
MKSLIAWMRSQFNRFFENPLMRRIYKNSGYLFSATGVAAVISLLQSILVGRMLGVAGFGLMGTITMFTSVVNKFVSFRMTELVIKYVGQYTETGDQRRAAAVFKTASLAEMLASVVAFLIIILLAPLAAEYLAKDANLAFLFMLYGLIILANLVSESSTGVLQVFDRYRNIASLNIVQSILTLGLIFWASITNGGIVQVVLAYLIGKALGALALTIAALIEANQQWGKNWWRTPFSLLRPQARELAHFAVSTNLSATLNLVNKDGELLWVSFFRSPVEAGFYRTAMAITNLVQMPISPLPQSTYPEVGREVTRKNWGNVRYILRQGTWIAGGFSLAVTLFLAFFGHQVILLLYKDPGFLPAYPALMILLVGFLVANAFYWNRIALLALGLPDFPTKVNLVLAVLKIAGILLLVPRFGYLASASLFAAYYIFSTSIAAWKTYQTIRIHEASGAPVPQPLPPEPETEFPSPQD